jgi:small subunit ribosomal protein S17
MSTIPESVSDKPQETAVTAVAALQAPVTPVKTGRKRILQGVVVSDKMTKTIVVAIHRRKLHRLYKKYITRTKKVKAHDETSQCHIGDTVRVVESRPLSRDKRWRLLDIVSRAS